MLDKIKKLKELKILFVEDECDITDVISDTLLKLEVEFYICINGKEALEILKNHEISLIVTDINMSVMDGIEFLKIVRKDNNNVDCIVMSAYTEDKYKQIAKDLGVKEYITKPFNFTEFLDSIDRL